MVLVYATSAEYATWSGTDAPAGIDAKLRAASLVLAGPLRTAYYEVDTNGMPTDADILAALRDATCAQVDYMISTGVDAAGVSSRVDSGSIGSLSVNRKVSVGGSKAGDPLPELGPTARAILLDSGLAFGGVGDLYTTIY